jgi:pimeloyl-ACP methyl ester carboxylesterase
MHYAQVLLLKTMCLEREPDLGLLNDALSVIHAVPASTIKSRLKVLASVDVRSLLPKVTIPVLYLQAIQDRLVGAQLSRQLISGLGNISVKEIDGPHMLLQSRQHDCAEAILGFIEK